MQSFLFIVLPIIMFKFLFNVTISLFNASNM